MDEIQYTDYERALPVSPHQKSMATRNQDQEPPPYQPPTIAITNETTATGHEEAANGHRRASYSEAVLDEGVARWVEGLSVGERSVDEKGVELGEPHRRISINDESETSSIDENLEVESLASSLDDQLTWRGRMQVALHSHWFHIFIIILVVLDAFIVLFELLLDVGAFSNIRCRGEGFLEQAEFCHYDGRSEGSDNTCGPPAILLLEMANITASPGEGIGEDGLCTCKFRDGKRICRPEDEGIGVNPALVLHVCSITILTIFMIEIILKLIAFRLKYFTHKFEVFDGLVVVISWILDIASLKEEEAFEALALLILLRLWRVVRIVNGAVLSSKAQTDAQLHEARHHARSIIHAYHKAKDRLSAAENENQLLQQRLKEIEVSAEEPTDRDEERRDSQRPLLANEEIPENKEELPREE